MPAGDDSDRSGGPAPNAPSQVEPIRFFCYSILVLLAIPIMLVTAGYHLRQQEFLLFRLILTSGLGLGIGWILALDPKCRRLVYNLNSLLFALLLFTLLIHGGEAGSMALWFYTFPLICHFLLGRRLGLLWNTCTFLLILAVFYTPFATFPYSTAFKLRFLASYLIISAFSFWFEARINHFQTDMIRQNLQLHAALDEVKTLRGLLPICCYCHKICNEQGFWDQLEQYIQKHSEAMFTHDICPECATKQRTPHHRSPS